MGRSTGVLFVIAGGVLVLIGVLAWSGALSWFGRLPGDIRIERPNTRLYIPITSVVVLSIVLTLVINLVRRLK